MRFSQLNRLQKCALPALFLTSSPFLFADCSYQRTTQITGGSMVSMMKLAGTFSSQARKMGDPVVSSLYLKDNRLANVSADSTEIIDLDKETITHIDNIKHTYTVVTFQQMRDQMEKARKEMEKKQAEQPAAAKPAPAQDSDVKMSFDVKVRKTGAQKQVSGLSTSEAIMTMTMNATDQKTQQTGAMAITNDMWLVPEIPGYDQVRDFYIRMGKKMGTVFSGAGMDFTKLLAQNPGATQAMADMTKEMQKIQGVPVMQIMRMGSTVDGKPLPAASEAPLPPDNSPAMPSAGDVAKQSAASMITSHFGLGGFGKKKNDTPPPQNSDNAGKGQPTPTSAILMETQETMSNFSTGPVDPSHFDVPAGYKQVETGR